MTLTAFKPRPTHKSNSCPVCGDIKGKCRTFDGKPLVLCMTADFAPGWKTFGSTKDGLWTQFAPETRSPFDRAEWQRRQRQEKPVALPQTLSLEERDRFYRDWLDNGSLHARDRADLQRRGITDLSIALSCDFGYAIPFKGLDGTYVGAQWRYAHPGEGGRYRWHNLPGGKQFPGTSEMPLAVYPVDQSTMLALVEGTGMKPMLAAGRLNAIGVGSAGGNHLASPIQLEAVLAAYPGLPLVAIPDAGDVLNPHVMRRHKRTAHQFPEAKFLWWGQVTKQANDIDEASPAELALAQLLTWAEFEAIAEPFLPAISQPPEKLSYEAEVEQVQAKLNTLTHKPTTELNQRFLGELVLPAPGTISAVSSACKTGKTESLGGFVDESGVKRFSGIIDKHRAAYPDARVFVIGYRKVLLKQTSKRLDITHIQDLQGKGYRAIQNTREIALCLDSIDKIDIDIIPPNSLVILDEGDATLRHGLEGGTLKGRQAEILSLLQKLNNKVLSEGGLLLLLEDNLTDLPIDTLKSLTENKYPVNLTVNTFKPSLWDVSIGDGAKAGVTKRIVDCLRTGERLLVPTSSQRYGEELDLIVQREFEGNKKIVRLDSKTVETLHDLVGDPNIWLKDAGIDLLIATPTAESGFSISVNVFDRVIGYLVGLETRAQIQLLERYRLDVPREIFCLKFSNFGDGNGRSLLPANVLKDWKLLTRQTAMVNRVEQSLEADAALNSELSQRLERFKNPSEQQEIWNRAAANFKARINGASAAMLERLTAALIERGHNVTLTKWEKDDRFKELHKQARQEIDLYGAIKFGEGDTSGTHIDDARVTLNSGAVTQEQRLIAYKRVMQDELPGAPLDDTEFVLKAIIENSGKFKRQTEFLFLCQNSNVASFLDKRAFESQLDKPFLMLRRFRHNRVKVDLMRGVLDKLMAIINSDSYRESDELVQEVKRWAVKNAFEIKRVFNSKVSEEHTAIDITNKLIRKLGHEPEAIKHEGSGRNGQKRSRVWKVADADCPHRQEILKALRLKWEREFSKTAYTILNTEEPLNKIVYATAENSVNLEKWMAPDSLKMIKEQWAAAETDQEREAWRQVIPIEVLERAIA